MATLGRRVDNDTRKKNFMNIGHAHRERVQLYPYPSTTPHTHTMHTGTPMTRHSVDDIPPELEALDETLRCKLCSEQFHAAVSISSPECGHSFCSECIRNAFHAQLSSLKREMKCPICRYLVKSPNLDKILVPNRTLQEAVLAFQQMLLTVRSAKSRRNSVDNNIDKKDTIITSTPPPNSDLPLRRTTRNTDKETPHILGSLSDSSVTPTLLKTSSPNTPAVLLKRPLQNYAGKNKKKLQELVRQII